MAWHSSGDTSMPGAGVLMGGRGVLYIMWVILCSSIVVICYCVLFRCEVMSPHSEESMPHPKNANTTKHTTGTPTRHHNTRGANTVSSPPSLSLARVRARSLSLCVVVSGVTQMQPRHGHAARRGICACGAVTPIVVRLLPNDAHHWRADVRHGAPCAAPT